LQEVTDKAYHTVKARLHSYGLEHNIYAREAVASPQKQRCVAVFSRWPLELLEGHLEVPYPELVLSTKVGHPELPIEFHCVHIPNGSDHGWEKIESFEAVYKGLAMSSDIPRVLCGDFNSPKEELPTGKIIPWRNTDERWANGEGTLEAVLGDEVVSLGPGDTVLAPAGVKHGFVNRSESKAALLASFPKTSLQRLTSD
jgi:hypothetical protein